MELTTQAERLRAQIADALVEKVVTIEGGEYDGTDMIRKSDVHAALWGKLPEPSSHSAAVLTPGRVVVWAKCPLCEQPAPVAVYLDPQLTVDPSGRVLKVTAKSKAASHVCGQTVLDAPTDEADGQLTVEDIVGESADEPPAESAQEDEDARYLCEFPYCFEPLNHKGKHKVVKPDDTDAALS